VRLLPGARYVPILITLAGFAPEAAGQDTADAAYLFAYRIKPGREAAFDSGYRRHLDWHARHRDSLSWLGWTVMAGTGQDMFVDGTFGITPGAFDARVEPKADGADADSNVTPYADAIYRQAYRLRRELGSSARLEEGQAAAMQLVTWITVRAGTVEQFEGSVRGLRRGAAGLDYAIYERTAGGPQPAYLLVVQAGSWTAIDTAHDRLIGPLLRARDAGIAHADSEVWRYRPDLTLIPRR
jgi:hypothetical protein